MPAQIAKIVSIEAELFFYLERTHLLFMKLCAWVPNPFKLKGCWADSTCGQLYWTAVQR